MCSMPTCVSEKERMFRKVDSSKCLGYLVSKLRSGNKSFLPAAQPTGQGKESVVLLLLLVVVVGVTTFHTTVSSNVHSKGV